MYLALTAHYRFTVGLQVIVLGFSPVSLCKCLLLPYACSLCVSLSMCSLFISMLFASGFESIWELPFPIWGISRRYRTTLQPPLVSWQPTPDNLHPSSFPLTPIKFLCHGKAKKSHLYFSKNISANLHCKTVNVTFRMKNWFHKQTIHQ